LKESGLARPRAPKLFLSGGKYYMLLSGKGVRGGAAALFSSRNMINWEFVKTVRRSKNRIDSFDLVAAENIGAAVYVEKGECRASLYAEGEGGLALFDPEAFPRGAFSKLPDGRTIIIPEFDRLPFPAEVRSGEGLFARPLKEFLEKTGVPEIKSGSFDVFGAGFYLKAEGNFKISFGRSELIREGDAITLIQGGKARAYTALAGAAEIAAFNGLIEIFAGKTFILEYCRGPFKIEASGKFFPINEGEAL
jgi:hypothetical protein